MTGHAGGLPGLTWVRLVWKSKTTSICLVYPMTTYHLPYLQDRKKSVFIANFMGFGCKCVIFAFSESHRLFLCLKEKICCRTMCSSVRGPRRDVGCASCRISYPTSVRGLNHFYPYKTGLAVIISVKILRVYVNIKEFSLTGVAWGVGERSDPTQVLGYSGRAPGSSPF